MDTTITLRVDAAWVAKIDRWRMAQLAPPSRSQIIRSAVDRLLDDEEGSTKKKG